MAKRMYFMSTPDKPMIIKENICEFHYYNGFSTSQKQKCISELHKNIKEMEKDARILEISTKSTNPIGVKLSAFNLKYYDENLDKEFYIENIFQSSKVFEKGGPYQDLLYIHPRDAKRDERLKTSGELGCFRLNQKEWDLSPLTMFYDWLYISALHNNSELATEILNYDTFTDIEFNHEKSINCQARSAAIFVSLSFKGKIEQAINDTEFLKTIYSRSISDKQYQNNEQIVFPGFCNEPLIEVSKRKRKK